MARIIISYARQDRTAVEHLVKDLELMGHDVWVDRDITGGAAWWNEVLEHIRQCDVLVFALSADSLASDACRRESYYAHQLHRAIIPVEVTQSVSRQLLPGDLHQLQVVSYLQESKEEFAQISRGIERAGRRPLPNPLPRPPGVPVSYLLRIQHRLNDPRPMPVADQDTIVDWLERGIRRDDEKREAQALLVRMQSRRGLDSVVAERISRALNASHAPPPPPSPQPLPVSIPAPPKPLRGWRTPMYTFLILSSLVIPLVGFVVGFTNVRFQDRRAQAMALIVVGLIGASLAYYLISAAESP